MLEAIRVLQPQVFVAENVDGMAQNFSGLFLRKILSDFQSAGYNVEYRVLNAVNYGVPQYRRRIFFIGVKQDTSMEISWPTPTHLGATRNGEFKSSWDVFTELFAKPIDLLPVTIEQSIGDLLEKDQSFPDHVTENIKEKDMLVIKKIGEGQKLCNVRFSNRSVFTWQIPEVFGYLSSFEILILEAIGKNRRHKVFGSIPNGNPLDRQTITKLCGIDVSSNHLESLEKKGYLKRAGEKFDLRGAMFCSGLYKRPVWTEPSPTIITLFHSSRYFIHPKEDRPFIFRECARLQTFPDSFTFLESNISIRDSYRLIGNAVPPLLARSIANSVGAMLTSGVRDEAVFG